MEKTLGRNWAALGAGGLSLLAIGLSATLIAAAERGPAPIVHVAPSVEGDVPPTPPAVHPDGHVELAGSGSNLPLMRALARAFEADAPGPEIVVHPSVGSGGGLRALRDGVVDAALISRPARPAELRGLSLRPLARVPVVLATGDAAAARAGLHAVALLALYAGERTRFANGSPARIVQREAGDSAHLAVAAALPGFAEVDAASRAASRFPIARSDAAMQQALLDARHATGLFDMGLIESQGLPLYAVRIDGVAPGADSLARGTYPFERELSIVTSRRPARRLVAFLAFLGTEPSRGLCRKLGYLPVGAPAPPGSGGASP